MSENHDAKAIIKVVEKLHRAELVSLTHGSSEAAGVLVMPQGMKVETIKRFLDEYRLAPERNKGSVAFSRLASFCEHVSSFKEAHSVLYCVEGTPGSLISVLNHAAKGEPRFGDFRASYAFPVSPEWQVWSGGLADMPQVKFAEFLEDRIADVIDASTVGPNASRISQLLQITYASPQRLMELSRGLTVNIDQQVAEHRNLSTGEAQLRFRETHLTEAGTPLAVPGGFVIAIPAFVGGALYQVPVRLRYRVRGGQVTWSMEPHGLDAVRRDAVNEACAEAAQLTGLVVRFGTP